MNGKRKSTVILKIFSESDAAIVCQPESSGVSFSKRPLPAPFLVTVVKENEGINQILFIFIPFKHSVTTSDHFG